MVFANHYDGMDLAGDMCRILVIDGKPKAQSARDRYIGSFRAGSSIINARVGQTLEQGLGRAVRSGSDYSVIFILNSDLVSFIGTNDNLKYFAPVTRAQVSLGLKLWDDIEDKSNPFNPLIEIINSCLYQDKFWKEYHQSEVLSAVQDTLSDIQLERLKITEVEQNAIQSFRRRSYGDASVKIESIINNKPNWFSNKDLSWYFQFAAQLAYPGDKGKSNDLQIKAKELASGAFHPPHGTTYTKIVKAGEQASLVRKNIASFQRPQDVSVELESILENLIYNPEIRAKDFEQSVERLGKFLGFSAQLPEKDLGAGPDILWCMTDTVYLLFEAKSRTEGRKIARRDVEQLYHSQIWFKNTYGAAADHSLVLLHESRLKEDDAEISENTYVIDQQMLDELKSNLRQFVKELEGRNTNSHTDQEISQKLQAYHLKSDQFRRKYLIKIR